jgi:hypothetical protein
MRKRENSPTKGTDLVMFLEKIRRELLRYPWQLQSAASYFAQMRCDAMRW